MQAEGNRERGNVQERGGDRESGRKWKESGVSELAHMHVCARARVCSTNLRGVDSSLLEGTAGGVMGTQVAVLAPVAAEGTVHT